MRYHFCAGGWLIAVCLLVDGGATLAAEGTNTLNVVVLYQEQRMLPSMAELDTSLREAIEQRAGRPVEFFNEYIEVALSLDAVTHPAGIGT